MDPFGVGTRHDVLYDGVGRTSYIQLNVAACKLQSYDARRRYGLSTKAWPGGRAGQNLHDQYVYIVPQYKRTTGDENVECANS